MVAEPFLRFFSLIASFCKYTDSAGVHEWKPEIDSHCDSPLSEIIDINYDNNHHNDYQKSPHRTPLTINIIPRPYRNYAGCWWILLHGGLWCSHQLSSILPVGCHSRNGGNGTNQERLAVVQ